MTEDYDEIKYDSWRDVDQPSDDEFLKKYKNKVKYDDSNLSNVVRTAAQVFDMWPNPYHKIYWAECTDGIWRPFVNY